MNNAGEITFFGQFKLSIRQIKVKKSREFEDFEILPIYTFITTKLNIQIILQIMLFLFTNFGRIFSIPIDNLYKLQITV